MFIPTFLEIALFVLININIFNPNSFNYQLLSQPKSPKQTVLASHAISLEKRYPDTFVNSIFKDNILLNIAYLEGKAKKEVPVNWNEITKPFHYEFSLNPGEVFAFHQDVLPEFQGKVTLTTNAHFNYAEQFKSDGYLTGDGVCHLASLIYWAAKDANLNALALTNHDFREIPEIPKEFGVSIYNYPGQSYSNQAQNLYITNNKTYPVIFSFDFDGENLKLSVKEVGKQNLIQI